MYPDSHSLMLIDNAMSEGEHLIDVVYEQADVQSPFYIEPNDQKLDVVFQILNFNLHKVNLFLINLFTNITIIFRMLLLT